ncbi:hypothetical protein AADU03_004800 [Escherichia coli]
MGTEAQQLQDEIKKLLNSMGWSINQFARELHELEYPGCDTDSEIESYQNKIKKQLSRPTTPPERLRHYLKLLQKHPDFSEANFVQPICTSLGLLDREIEKGLIRLSKKLSDPDQN